MMYRTLLFATALTAGFASFALAQQDQTQMPSNQPNQMGTGTNSQNAPTQPIPENQDQTGQQPDASQSTQSNQNNTEPMQQGQTPSTNQAQTTARPNSEMQSVINLPEACRTSGQAAGQTGSQPDMPSSSMQGMDQQNMADMTETQRGLHDAIVQSMGPMSAGMMAKDADVAWICAMIPHHQAAIAMARAGLKGADNAVSKRLAEAIIRRQEREIERMINWVERNAERESRDEVQATGSTTTPQDSDNQSGSGTTGTTNEPQQQ